MESKKTSNINGLIYKMEIGSQIQKTNLWFPGREREEDKLGDGTDKYTLLHRKQINNKDLLQGTRNSTWYSVMAYMGKESKKE